MKESTPLEKLLRRAVPFPPPSDSAAFARGVMARVAADGRPRRPAHRSLWLLAAASLAAAAGLHLAVRPSRPEPVAQAPLPVAALHAAAAGLDERIDRELRRPYQDELDRLRADLRQAANFALASTGYELALE